MPVGEQTYVRVALDDSEDVWELYRGRLRVKPAGTFAHNRALSGLAHQFVVQLDWPRFQVSVNGGRLRCSPQDYFVPDLFVFPDDLTRIFDGRPDALEVYDAAVPLVVEIWEPPVPAFDYDIDAKFGRYRDRNDREIWRLHPYERTLMAWRRNPDGAYETLERRGGLFNRRIYLARRSTSMRCSTEIRRSG